MLGPTRLVLRSEAWKLVPDQSENEKLQKAAQLSVVGKVLVNKTDAEIRLTASVHPRDDVSQAGTLLRPEFNQGRYHESVQTAPRAILLG